jgi:hypothetical protein
LGEADRNLEKIVEGLRKLFGILEAMKLVSHLNELACTRANSA